MSEPVLFQRFIAEEAQQVSQHENPGVYFLLQGEEVVYVGMSESSCLERVITHRHDSGKEFDRYYIHSLTLEEWDLDELESHLIFQLQPRYNSALPCNELYATVRHLAEKLDNCGPAGLKKRLSESGVEVRDGYVRRDEAQPIVNQIQYANA